MWVDAQITRGITRDEALDVIAVEHIRVYIGKARLIIDFGNCSLD